MQKHDQREEEEPQEETRRAENSGHGTIRRGFIGSVPLNIAVLRGLTREILTRAQRAWDTLGSDGFVHIFALRSCRVRNFSLFSVEAFCLARLTLGDYALKMALNRAGVMSLLCWVVRAFYQEGVALFGCYGFLYSQNAGKPAIQLAFVMAFRSSI